MAMAREIAAYAKKLLFFVLLFAGALSARASSNSTISLDFRSASLTAELVLPLSELELAFGQPLTLSPEEIVPRFGPALGQYIQDHVRPISPDGRKWQVQVESLAVRLPKQSRDQSSDLVARLDMRPPDGDSSRKLTLHYDVINREAVTHETFVMVRSDWHSGLFPHQPPDPIGSIRAASDGFIEIDRSNTDWWLGFAFFVSLGLQSLIEQGSHLLFLVVLLLPVPLLSLQGNESTPADHRQIFWRLAKLITTFSLGYSLSFLASILSGALLPQKMLIVLSALTIIAAAILAIHPVFPSRPGIASMIFGLIYGLIFAGSMPSFGLSPDYTLPAALAYDIGIGIMLLLTALLFTPSLILLSRTSLYQHVRITIASLALLASSTSLGLGLFSN